MKSNNGNHTRSGKHRLDGLALFAVRLSVPTFAGYEQFVGTTLEVLDSCYCGVGFSRAVIGRFG